MKNSGSPVLTVQKTEHFYIVLSLHEHSWQKHVRKHFKHRVNGRQNMNHIWCNTNLPEK